MVLNVSDLGQVFTPPDIVERMLVLRQNRGTILEPAAGDGAFLSELEPSAQAIEIDQNLAADSRITRADFFSYPAAQHQFDTIIGNPPYVRYQDIPAATKARLPAGFDRRTNLYLFFIHKCLDHLADGGELILITPRDFIKATSARRLNARLYAEGTITHFYDLGDRAIFRGYSPNCAIWRWEKGRTDRRAETGGEFGEDFAEFRFQDGQIWFGNSASALLGDFFDVKVGAVSGADHIFTHSEGDTKFVCSATRTDGSLRPMIYNKPDRRLLPHKAELMRRRIRRFDETNWWQWGRLYHDRPGPRIYVNCKTRQPSPFFVSEERAYDGSVLALFPKRALDLERAAAELNRTDWARLGFASGGRLLFSQRVLTTAPALNRFI